MKPRFGQTATAVQWAVQQLKHGSENVTFHCPSEQSAGKIERMFRRFAERECDGDPQAVEAMMGRIEIRWLGK